MRQSIRIKLTLLFLFTIVCPVVIIVLALPSYYLQLIRNQQSTLMEGTLAALTSNIETYLDDLERITVTPYYHSDMMDALKMKAAFNWEGLKPFERFQAEQALSTALPNALKNLRQDILGTILLPMDGSVYITSPSFYTAPVKGYQFQSQPWYVQAVKADGRVAFISVHEQDYLDGARAKVFSVARLIKDPDSKKPLGVIMADADTVAIERIMSGLRLTSGSIAVILDDKGELIYASRPLDDGVRRRLAEGSPSVGGEHDSYSVVSRKVSRSNWTIDVLFPESVIKVQQKRVYILGIALASGGFVVALVLYATVSRWMVTPFKEMVQTMKRVQRGDLQTFYPVRGKDEIAQLGSNLNTMIERLGELIDREFRAVLGQRNAEYRALQSQIQPHFLYNTLNGFIGLNRSGQRMLLERAILSLSGMLRYTLDSRDLVRLKEEMEFVSQYCELQHMRFAEKFNFEIRCSQDIETVLVPKLLLQPIVENAVLHGIEPCDRQCTLVVEAFRMESEDGTRPAVEIVVRDDGAGFEPGSGRSGGVGFPNVSERLHLACEGSSIRVTSQAGEGTLVLIHIPIKEADLR
ncbi:cache domain-containing sensor histidine kinase [Paenibacillus gansuensis]|uniref:Sensor histidine kinase n=1 Tax=Paenibacillus gansuensis TaxID=306542 RepID=A0ABW5PI30_9BACL